MEWRNIEQSHLSLKKHSTETRYFTSINKKLIATIFITLLCGILPAISLAQCLNQKEMAVKLSALGQKEIIFANIKEDAGEKSGWIFTLNPNDQIGYILTSDRPIGEKNSRICPSTRLEEVSFFDVRELGLASGTLFKSTDKEAETACDEFAASSYIKRNLCVPFNSTARTLERQNFRVAINGFEITQRNERKSTAVVYSIFGNLHVANNEESGYIYASSIPEGASIKGPALYDFQYTEEGLFLLNRLKKSHQ